MKNVGVADPAAVLLKLKDKQHRKNRGWREKLKEKRDTNIKPRWQTAILPSPCQIATADHKGLPSFLFPPFLQRVTPADINLVILLVGERHRVFSLFHFLFTIT